MGAFEQFFQDLYFKINPVPQPQPVWNKILDSKIIKFLLSVINKAQDTNYWILLITVVVICVSLWTFIRLWDWFKEIIFLIKTWIVPILAMYGFTQLPYIMIFIRYTIDFIEYIPEFLTILFDNFKG